VEFSICIDVDDVDRAVEFYGRGLGLTVVEHHPDWAHVKLGAQTFWIMKAPAGAHEAVRRAGGQVVAQATVKPWELAGWVREQAAQMGIAMDASAAKALVAEVGERQQRLLRELEKLALEADEPEAGTAGREIGVEELDRRVARSAQWRAFTLADALLAGDGRRATVSYLRLREQGERLPGLIYLMAQRLREGLAIAVRLRAGESVAEVRRGLRILQNLH